jgi:hypothetical protein
MYIETLDSEKISKARDRWSGLSESDLRGIGNDSERLVDIVSRKGGMDREQASREVDEFLSSCGCSEKGNPDSCSRSGSSRTSDRPATSTDDQTGEMAAAQPGRKTRPEPKKYSE